MPGVDSQMGKTLRCVMSQKLKVFRKTQPILVSSKNRSFDNILAGHLNFDTSPTWLSNGRTGWFVVLGILDFGGHPGNLTNGYQDTNNGGTWKK